MDNGAFSRVDFLRALESRASYLTGKQTSHAISESVAIREYMFEFDKDADADELILKSGSPSYQTISDLVSLVLTKINQGFFKGLGIEIGAGLGLLSSSLLAHDRENAIRGLVALEGCRPYVEYGIRRVSSKYIPKRHGDVIPYFDSFEELKIQDATFDFAIQIESLHHADNPIRALKEIHRTLNQGSYFLSIDRSWPNFVSVEVLDSLLDHEYSEKWKRAKGFEIDAVVTRRDNGEHEYRDFEWQDFFTKAGFDIVTMIHLHPMVQPWEVLKTICCQLGMQKLLGIKIKPRKGILLSSLRKKVKFKLFDKQQTLVSPHPRALTLILARKLTSVTFETTRKCGDESNVSNPYS